jgi:hypothetical protein
VIGLAQGDSRVARFIDLPVKAAIALGSNRPRSRRAVAAFEADVALGVLEAHLFGRQRGVSLAMR